jgi:hypothetical protein
MCSTTDERLGRICRAINELAARSTSGDGTARAAAPAVGADGADGAAAAPTTSPEGRDGMAAAADPGANTTREPGADTTKDPRSDTTNEPGAGVVAESSEPTADDTAARLAAIWEMVADANPELAKRLPGYLSAAE